MTPHLTPGPRKIGTTFRDYCRGRDDARFGRVPERWVCPECGRSVAADEDGCCVTCGADCSIEMAAPSWAYALGFKDEGRRMEAERRLAQLELPLFERSERRRAPRRRANERASLGPLTELDIPPAR